MRKGTVRLSLLILMVAILLVSLPSTAQASTFNWNTGISTAIDLIVNPAPAWLQLFSEGVKITDQATLCHPFDRGIHNWIAVIYQLKNGKWLKLPTTMNWIPNNEGHYTACAQALEAGTYALFGYYKEPVVPTPLPVVELAEDWNTGIKVYLDLEKNPAPAYLQLLSSGVNVPAKTEICHAFTFGLYDWVAEIRQLKKGEWVQVDTTTSWSPNIEGTYTACATAPESGVFALFGYYHIEVPPTPVPVVDLSGDWNTGTEVALNLALYPSPDWLQLFSSGITVNGKAQICHPFVFGNYGWSGEIRQLKDGKWLKLETTTSQTDPEAPPFACAQTAGAGTYALFGYVP